jgi:hypothetical protein
MEPPIHSNADPPLVDPEHMAGVEEAIRSLAAGRGVELTEAEWDAIEREGIAAARRDRGRSDDAD